MNAKTCFSSQFWCPNYVTRYKNTPLFFEPSTHALYSTTRVVFRRCPLESPLNTGRWTIRPLVSDVGNLGSSGRARGGRETTISKLLGSARCRWHAFLCENLFANRSLQPPSPQQPSTYLKLRDEHGFTCLQDLYAGTGTR